MECLIVEQGDVDLEERQLILRGEEAHHAAKVLRLRAGELFLASDLEGTCYEVDFTESCPQGKHEIEVIGAIQQVLPEFGESARDVQLIIGYLSQPARWEFLLEKSVELGVRSIQPIVTERSERRDLKTDRSSRILKSALKQSKRSRLPVLGELSTLSEALSEAVKQGRAVFILHEGATEDDDLLRQLQAISSDRVTLVVGPEGGFSDEEVRIAIELGAQVSSLGSRRLRAETAAIVALALAQSA